MNTPPFLISLENLQLNASRLRENDSALVPLLEKLIKQAEEKLSAGPFTVMNKTRIPPSGDKHDFLSLGPYWWPDPEKPDGLPYIRRDGEVNPETADEATDRYPLQQMQGSVRSLALAYYFTKEEKYAEHAAFLLRTWFLDAETKMNPHLEYSQGIPGRYDGRDFGIIVTHGLPQLFDHVKLLESSSAWTSEDQEGLKQWSEEFFDWLLNSEKGKGEACKHNNHGTWYDVQAAYHALYTGQPEKALAVLTYSEQRLISQIEPDGAQPHELERTKSFGYSTMNLMAFMSIAELGTNVGLDYWNFEKDGRGSIRKAVEFLLEKAPVSDLTTWPYQQLGSIESIAGNYNTMLLKAESGYKDGTFAEAAKLLMETYPEATKNSSLLLFHP